MAVFWDTEPCDLLEIDRLLEVITASIVMALMEAINTFKRR
jgi:hypothetical protein